MADAIADNAEQRGDQGSDVAQRSEDRQQEHRSGRHKDVPAENEVLHLERPGREQIGRPLEAVVADAKWRKRGRARERCQGIVARLIAFHPRSVSCWNRFTALPRPQPAPADGIRGSIPADLFRG
jgi:hypothetical protein